MAEDTVVQVPEIRTGTVMEGGADAEKHSIEEALAFYEQTQPAEGTDEYVHWQRLKWRLAEPERAAERERRRLEDENYCPECGQYLGA